MESKIQRMSRSVYVLIGPEGATNFGIVKANEWKPRANWCRHSADRRSGGSAQTHWLRRSAV